MDILNKCFGLSKSDVKTEFFAGLTTFCTISYIIFVVPKLLEQAGLPYGAAFTAVLLIAGFANIFSGFLSNLPFALAPLLSDSAFIALSLVSVMGYSWHEVAAAMLIIGIVLLIMTVIKFRIKFLDTLPFSIKLSFTAGLGFYIMLSGLKAGGLIDFSNNILSLHWGNLNNIHYMFMVFGIVLICLLDRLNIKMSVLIAIIVLAIAEYFCGDIAVPKDIFVMPHSVAPILFQFDFSNIFSMKFLVLFFLLFMLINTELHGSIVSLMMNYKENDFYKLGDCVKKFLYADSSSTVVSSCMGIPTTGVYVDSVIGIRSGGKSGLTVVFVGILFLISLFFMPVFEVIPPYIYAAILIYIGLILLTALKEIKYNDFTEYLTCWIVLGTIVVSLNIALGMIVGFIVYPLLKLITGRFSEVPKVFLVFTVLSIVFFFIRH